MLRFFLLLSFFLAFFSIQAQELKDENRIEKKEITKSKNHINRLNVSPENKHNAQTPNRKWALQLPLVPLLDPFAPALALETQYLFHKNQAVLAQLAYQFPRYLNPRLAQEGFRIKTEWRYYFGQYRDTRAFSLDLIYRFTQSWDMTRFSLAGGIYQQQFIYKINRNLFAFHGKMHIFNTWGQDKKYFIDWHLGFGLRFTYLHAPNGPNFESWQAPESLREWQILPRFELDTWYALPSFSLGCTLGFWP